MDDRTRLEIDHLDPAAVASIAADESQRPGRGNDEARRHRIEQDGRSDAPGGTALVAEIDTVVLWTEHAGSRGGNRQRVTYAAAAGVGRCRRNPAPGQP